jgi:DEAD/DEAH box helicase domain-containing protein
MSGLARDRSGFDFGAFLGELKRSRDYQGQIVHVEHLQGRPANYGELAQTLPSELQQVLHAEGIDRLYCHQVQAIESVRAGHNLVVVTGTASGKTLCYNLPVAETLLADPDARALYLFPTKALAQDQLRALRRWGENSRTLGTTLKCGTYDGDTPTQTRRTLREKGNVILSNPDMLHQGILPNHSRWAPFFSRLRYVVLDEIHTYRGIFGSNVACVVRRLRRICDHYGARPIFVCCSATIANPQEHAERLLGLPVRVVDEDGSPRGPKYFVFWNPPYLDDAQMERRSSNVEAERLMVGLIERNVQTIAFVKARIVAELLYRYVREALCRYDHSLAEAVKPYRAGYLPEDRRAIEQALFSGELLGVIATNALELGIDVGGLDAALIVGYPQTIASTWQQAGRAGRGLNQALAVLIAYNETIDQYLMRHPEYFFGKSPEHAIIDANNPFILAAHLRCAAAELPLRDEELSEAGEVADRVMSVLQEFGEVRKEGDYWLWTGPHFPAAKHSLRTMSTDTFTIVDATNRERVIGQVDAISASELVYPEAVYLHEGETHLVRELDWQAKVAYVERKEVDYYTQAVLEADLRAGEVEAEKESRGGRVIFGEADVTWQTVMFKKIKFYQLDSIGYGKVDLPPQTLATTAMGLVPKKEHLDQVRQWGRDPQDALAAVRNVAIHVLPLFAMCDKADIGGIVDSANLGAPTIFIYDRYPGGLGFAQKGYEVVEDLLEACLSLVQECGCEEGCPSCVGLPILRPGQHIDPDLGRGYPIPDKEGALVLLHAMLGKPDYVPKPLKATLPQPQPPVPAAAKPPPPQNVRLEQRLREVLRRKAGPDGLTK